jgi:hypothetical protein
MKTLILFIFSTFFLLLFGCDKYHAKKLSGKYSCKVEYNYWDMTPLNIDSIYYEDLVIEQKGKFVVVLGTSIHIDSLWKEKEYYEGYIHNYMKVLFKNDSVYIIKSSGGLGGNASWTYKGVQN